MMVRRFGTVGLTGAVPLVLLVLSGCAPAWQGEMDQARLIAAAEREQAMSFTFPAPESGRSGVFVFYNNLRPFSFCYMYMIPGASLAKAREFCSTDGRWCADVQFWPAGTLEHEDGATLVERAGNHITKVYRKALGQALVGVEVVPFQSARPGVWQWRAAPNPRIIPQVAFPAKLIVDLSPDAVAQITVAGPSDDEQLALARRILESLRTTKDPECYFSVLEGMYKAMYENR